MNGLTKSKTRYYQMPIMRKGLSITPIFVKCKAISKDASKRTSRRFLSLWNMFDPIKRTLQLYEYLSPKSNLFHDEFSVYFHRNNMPKESYCSTHISAIAEMCHYYNKIFLHFYYKYAYIISIMFITISWLSMVQNCFKPAELDIARKWGSSISFISLLCVNGAW